MLPMPCNYTYHDGTHCVRSSRNGGYCYFHGPTSNSFQNGGRNYLFRLLVLARRGDGDWRGFNLPNEIDVNKFETNCKIDISETKIEKLSLSSCTFHDEVIAENCTFSEDLSLQSVYFEQNLVINQSVFFKTCELNGIFVKRRLSAFSCDFQSAFTIRGDIEHSAIFNNTTFHDKATFTFTSNATIYPSSLTSTIKIGGATLEIIGSELTAFQKFMKSLKSWLRKTKKKIVSVLVELWKATKTLITSMFNWLKRRYTKIRKQFPHDRKDVKNYYLFSGEVQFVNATFENPRYVKFSGVDLRRASFQGTDLRDISFVGNNWYQKTLGRSGLYEDVEQRQNPNYHDRTEKLPYLENTYRNIRISLEHVKDFNNANDFFVGEMEAQRKQLPFFQKHLFSINALYKIISKYGTSPLRCIIWFLLFAALHTLLLNHLRNNDTLFLSLDWFTEFWNLYIYSLQTMLFQRDKITIPGLNEIYWLPAINLLFSILGPILAGLFALSVRARIKRH